MNIKFLCSLLLKKLTAVFIIVSFFIPPMSVVFAQEVSVQVDNSSNSSINNDTLSTDSTGILTQEQSTDPSINLSPEDMTSAPTDDSSTPTDEIDQSLEDSKLTKDKPQMNAMSSSLTANQSILNQMSAFSTLKQIVPEPDPTTGALLHNYPITVPPGRNGMQPNLSLQYNSQNSDASGAFGYGWSTTIPFISRINKTGVDQLYSASYFNSTMSGDLVNTSGTSYAAKSEKGDFLKYTYSSNTWTVTDKVGTVYTFGSSASTRQDDPGNSSNIYKWMLEKTQDTNGNFVTYTYYKNSGQIYPDTIVYTSNASDTGIFEIDFLRTSRSDVAVSNATGFTVTSNYLINEIDAKISGTWVNKYALAYTTGANGRRTLLNTVIRSGKDESGTITTLPATTFSYETTGPSWSSNSTWNLSSSLSATWNSGQSIAQQFVDLNGDGLVDNVQTISSNGTLYSDVEINTGSGWSSNSSWNLPTTLSNNYNSNNVQSQFIDINGDGLPDLVQYLTYSGNVQNLVYINNGSGWTAASSSWNLPNPLSTYNAIVKVQFADFNGDGLLDYIEYFGSGVTIYSAEYLNTGSGWTSTSTWNLSSTLAATWNSGQLIAQQFVDLNSDGMVDNVQTISSGGTLYSDTLINTGTGWSSNSSWNLPTTLSNTYNSNNVQSQFVDLNGDGLADLVQYLIYAGNLQNIEYINNGNGWTTAGSPWNLPNPLSTYNTLVKVQFADLNGDGLADYIEYFGSGVTMYSGEYLNNSKIDDLLTQVTYPEGGSSTITYKSSTNYVNGSTLLNPNMPFTLPTVSQVVVNDGLGNTGTTSYSYANGLFYFDSSDFTTRKFAGFGDITRTDPVGNVTKTYYHQGNSTNTSLGEYSDSYAKIGEPYRVEKYDNASHLYSLVINKWDSYNIGTMHDFVKLARTTTLNYDGNSGHRDTAQEYTYDNTYGNVTQKTDWGEVTGSTDGSFTDTGFDKSVENILYVTNTGNYVVGLPYDDATVDQSSNPINETRTYYDGNSLGTTGVGNPTKVEKWVTGSTYVNTQKGYNTTYGIVTSFTDERGKVTSYSYDSYHLYPTTVTDANSNATSYLYDYSSGKAKETTDQNGFVYDTVYDGLDRVIEKKVPGFTTPFTPVTKITYTYTDTSGAVSIHQVDYLDGSTTADIYYYLNGLHQIIQDRKEAESNYNVRDYVYNNLNIIYKESLPYNSSGSSKTSATSTTALYTTYTYDPLQRPATTVNAVGTTSYAYDDWKTSVTDPRSKVKDYYNDAHGNLVQVDEHNSGSTYTTTYTWNLNGKLLSITDALSNSRAFTYDGLGRRLTAEDLHSSGDGTYGSWSYTYDNAGNMTQSVSPESKTVNYTYDDLNHILTENYTGATGTEISYSYDTCTNGVGRLCSVIMTSGASTTYTYDSDGNIASEEKTINSNAYTTSYTYDRQDNQLIITYPDSAQVRYTFNTAGLLNQVERKESDGSFSNVISNLDYSPTDQVTVTAYVNGVTTTNTYDASNNYRLSNKTTTNGVPTNLQNISYTYDANGNITQIVDASTTNASKTVTYSYDDLNRMTSATATNVASGQSTYTQNFTYNAIGNITAGPVGSYTYAGSGYANPHAATSINSVTNTYDHDGNVLTDGTLTNTWNYKDQLAETTNGTFTRDYKYDEGGNRVSSTDGTTTTVYPNKYYNYDGTKKTKSIYAGDQLVATIETVGAVVTPYYDHTDHLGSVAVVSDSSGAQSELLDYMPYGSQRISSGSYSSQRRSLGQIYDTDTNLNYYRARYQNGLQGRFISEDPQFWNFDNSWLADPQNQNSYSYARNNPVTLSDPSGRFVPLLIGAAYMAAPYIIAGAEMAGAALAGYLIARDTGTVAGTAMSNAPQSYKDDVYGNIAEGWGAVVSAGMQLSSSAATESTALPRTTLQANKVAGAAFENETGAALIKTQASVAPQITLETQSGIRTRVDFMTKNMSGQFCLFECKSSATAPLTKNQSLAFPEIQQSGATVVGKGKEGFLGGMSIPATKVNIVRPNR